MLFNEVAQVFTMSLSNLHSGRELKQLLKIYKEDIWPGIEHDPNRREILERHIELLMDDYPIQYLARKIYFFDRYFYIDDQVLIPRPETEELVREAQLVFPRKKKINILDVGTGSGVIAVLLKNYYEESHVIAIDNNYGAINVAKRNGRLVNNEVEFIALDFLEQHYRLDKSKYDIIISNPPYISSEEKVHMSISTIKHEPQMALFPTDPDFLVFYKAILDFSKRQLNQGGYIFLELNEYHAAYIQAMYLEDFADVELIYDMQGKPRILKVSRLKE